MQPYITSLLAGIVVGLMYALLRVRSPAPPVIALVGLLGMLGGEWSAHEVKILVGLDQPVPLIAPTAPRRVGYMRFSAREDDA